MCHVLPLYLSLSLCLSLSLSLCLSFSFCTTIYLSLILSLFLYLCPSFFPSLFVSFPEAMCLFLSSVHLLVSVFKLPTAPLFASLHRYFLPPQTISFCVFSLCVFVSFPVCVLLFCPFFFSFLGFTCLKNIHNNPLQMCQIGNLI